MLCNLKIDVSNKISCARIKKYILKEPVRFWKLLFVPVMFASIVVIAKPPAFWNIIDPPPTPHPKVSQNSKVCFLEVEPFLLFCAKK